MAKKPEKDSRIYVKDLNISPTIGPLLATLDFNPDCLNITIAKCAWPKNILTTENYLWIGDVGRTQKLPFRSISFVQQTAAKEFTIFSARKEIGIVFNEQLFANFFAKTLSEVGWMEPNINEPVFLFERLTESKLGNIMGLKAIKQYHRMRDVHELFKFKYWINIAYPKLKPDARSPYIQTDIQSYETANAAALLAIAKLIRKDIHYIGQKRPVEVQAVVSSPVMVEEPQQAEQPVFLQSQVDEEDDDADDDVLPMPLSPKKKKKSVARRAFKGIRRFVNVGLRVFKRK